MTGLRRYLLNGGFLMVDDFWGEDEWNNFYQQIKRVFPDREPVELPLEHEIFHCVYDLKEKPQIPSINHWQSGRTTERLGRPGSSLSGALRRQGADDGHHLPQHRPGRRLGTRRRGPGLFSRVLGKMGLPDGHQHRDLRHDSLTRGATLLATDIDAYLNEQQTVEQIHAGRRRIETELSKVIIGQKEVIEQLLIACSPAGIA